MQKPKFLFRFPELSCGDMSIVCVNVHWKDRSRSIRPDKNQTMNFKTSFKRFHACWWFSWKSHIFLNLSMFVYSTTIRHVGKNGQYSQWLEKKKNVFFPLYDFVMRSSFLAAVDGIASINIDSEALTRKTVSHGLKLRLCVTHKFWTNSSRMPNILLWWFSTWWVVWAL